MHIVVVSGGFDPLHTGHINLFDAASHIGDKLIVLVNSDEWLINKKGRYFMPFDERATIIERLEMVDYVYSVDDTDFTVTKGLEQIKEIFGHIGTRFTFANGGDRDISNVTEKCDGFEFVFNVGGEKTNSSSKIIEKFTEKA